MGKLYPKKAKYSMTTAVLSMFCAKTKIALSGVVGWLVLGFNGPLRQYFSLYPAVYNREGERGEKG